MATETLAATGEPQRFRIERQLGAGAFGTVFVAWDREREQRMALKRLERIDPASIYRFKQEFRALAGLSHPNLVRLHEFFAWGDTWCFTMDWVDGRRFDQWVRPDLIEVNLGSGIEIKSTNVGRNSAPATERQAEPQPNDSVTLQEAQGAAPRFDLDRLRHALKGLFCGVFALHGAGILHRDLKPSNVLVQADGHVLILDFGLVATEVVESHRSVDGNISGTPAYMSPEQARGESLTVASDYYSIGVMLYEIFTGQVPFAGPMPRMLESRSKSSPPELTLVTAALPPDLSELTMALLRVEPSERPTRADIVKILQIEETPPSFTMQSTPGGTFIGREFEMSELMRAFEMSRSGRTVVVQVHGPSGFGKTTLVRQFLTQLSTLGDIVTLEGRCFERESMPFKAFDSLIDSLGSYLRRLRPVEAATFLPRDTPALLRLFPSLGRLDFIASVPGRPPSNDPHELRRRAFSALREIFTRITDIHPLVLFIDDVQWGDTDSATLLRHLLGPPEPPALLLIAAARDDASQQSAVLQALGQSDPIQNAWDSNSVSVGPLSLDQAAVLARRLLGRLERGQEQAQAIAEESAGNPLFVAQLVRSVAQGRQNEGNVSLQHVVAERVTSLPTQARLVMEVLACSERPVHESVLRAACQIDSATLYVSVDRLRDEQFVVVTSHKEHTQYEIPHDKLRSAVRDGLVADTIGSHHLALANALQDIGDADPEALAHHFGAANVAERSVFWNERAADRAAEGLAFDRAVKLYQRALNQTAATERPRLLLKLAEALAHAGRGAQAALAFLELAETSAAELTAEYRKRAATQFLRAGHIMEALATFGPVLEQMDLALPKTPQAALASLLYHRTRLKLRGLDFTERAIAAVPKQELERIDLCWALGTGLSGIDLVRSAHYHTFLLIHSLDSGETGRVVRALSMHAVLKSLESTDGAQKAEKVAERAYQIAQRVAQPSALGWATAARAAVAWGLCDFRRCVEYCDQAAQLLRESADDNFREIGSLQVWFALHSLFLLGEVKQFTERAPACTIEAEARGDRYTLSTAQAYDMPLYWALRDRPKEGRREADAALEPWPRDAWYHQHWAHLRAMCLLDLYEGEGRRVIERVNHARAFMKRTMQLRLRTLRIEFNYLEARGWLADAVEAGFTRRHAKLIRDKIDALNAERSVLASVYAQALNAGLVTLMTQARAISAFFDAEKAFERHSMPLHAAAALYVQGRLLGGQLGQEKAQHAQNFLEVRGIVNPRRFAAMLMPMPTDKSL